MNIQSRPQVQPTPVTRTTAPTAPTQAPNAPAPTESASPSPTPPLQRSSTSSSPTLAGPEEQKKIESTIAQSNPQALESNAHMLAQQHVHLALRTQALSIRTQLAGQAMGFSNGLLTNAMQQKQVQSTLFAEQNITLDTEHAVISPTAQKLHDTDVKQMQKESARQTQFNGLLMIPDPGSTQERIKVAAKNLEARSQEAQERYTLALQLAEGDTTQIKAAEKLFQQATKANNLLFQAEQGNPEQLNPLSTGGLGQSNAHRGTLISHYSTVLGDAQQEKAEHLIAITTQQQKISPAEKALAQTQNKLSEAQAQESQLDDRIKATRSAIYDVESYLEGVQGPLNKLSVRTSPAPSYYLGHTSEINPAKMVEHYDQKMAAMERDLEQLNDEVSTILQTKIETVRENKSMSNVEIKNLVLSKDKLADNTQLSVNAPALSKTSFTEQEQQTLAKRNELIALIPKYREGKAMMENELKQTQDRLSTLQSEKADLKGQKQALQTVQSELKGQVQTQQKELDQLQQQLKLMNAQTKLFDLKVEAASLHLQYNTALAGCP